MSFPLSQATIVCRMLRLLKPQCMQWDTTNHAVYFTMHAQPRPLLARVITPISAHYENVSKFEHYSYHRDWLTVGGTLWTSTMAAGPIQERNQGYFKEQCITDNSFHFANRYSLLSCSYMYMIMNNRENPLSYFSNRVFRLYIQVWFMCQTLFV